jgi:hypothetical protein
VVAQDGVGATRRCDLDLLIGVKLAGRWGSAQRWGVDEHEEQYPCCPPPSIPEASGEGGRGKGSTAARSSRYAGFSVGPGVADERGRGPTSMGTSIPTVSSVGPRVVRGGW